MFWIVTLHGLVGIYQHFWGTLTFIFRAEDGGSTSSKMLVSTYTSTRHYNSEDQPNMLITMRTWNLIRKFDYCYVYISVFKVCMSQCMFTVISLAIFYSHFLLNRCNRLLWTVWGKQEIHKQCWWNTFLKARHEDHNLARNNVIKRTDHERVKNKIQQCVVSNSTGYETRHVPWTSQDTAMTPSRINKECIFHLNTIRAISMFFVKDIKAKHIHKLYH
jgi:hypothetical protein